MTDLAAQVLAALDRAEETAQAAFWHIEGEIDDGVWTTGIHSSDECHIEGIGITIYDEGGHNAEQAAHIAANDPAHVLRLTTALREVVELHAPGSERDPMTGVWVETDWCATCDADTFPCPTLLALTSVWDVPGDNT